MSLAFANKVIAGLRKYGVTVHFWPNWQNRGNGQTSDYEGGSMHHTASNYGFAYGTLVTGRSDLSGPLCNSAGNEDGSITIIAAHPANHAGASGGRSMGPLPVTSLFNKRMWGHEIVYPGNSPMRPAQYNSMVILGKVLTEVLGRPNAEWIRAHAETSITGKWDPGYAPGKTIDMGKVRREINNFKGGDDDLKEDERSWLADVHMTLVSGVYEEIRKKDAKLNKDLGFVKDQINNNLGFVSNKVSELEAAVDALSKKLDKVSTPDIDEQALAAALVKAGIGTTPAEVAEAVRVAMRAQWSK